MAHIARYDPDVIHECNKCGRSYAIRPIEGMNHWHFYTSYCSAWCAMPEERRGFTVVDGESVFLFLLDRAQGIYRDLTRQMKNHGRIINPHYWYGWDYSDPHPYRFASEFMDRTERSLFLSKREREQYAQYLFGLTNQMHYGADAP